MKILLSILQFKVIQIYICLKLFTILGIKFHFQYNDILQFKVIHIYVYLKLFTVLRIRFLFQYNDLGMISLDSC